jgi:hypothetical protein
MPRPTSQAQPVCLRLLTLRSASAVFGQAIIFGVAASPLSFPELSQPPSCFFHCRCVVRASFIGALYCRGWLLVLFP